MVTRFYDGNIYEGWKTDSFVHSHFLSLFWCLPLSIKKNLFIYTDGEVRVISLKYITCILLKPMALFIWKVKIKYANNKELYIFG